MTKNQWRIALAGIAIVVTAQFVQMLHGIELREVVLSENGHVFASSSYRKPIATSIYHWQPGLSARERIIDSPLPVHSLACTANGQLLLYIKGPVLEGWDLKTKDKRWTFAEGRMKHADLFPCMSDQFTLIVENAIWNDTTSNRPPIMHLIRNADGYYVGEIGDAMFASVLCVGDTLNYQDRFSVRKAVRVQQPSSVEPKIVPATTELNGRHVTVWDGTRRKRLRHQTARGDLEVRYTNTASNSSRVSKKNPS